MTASLTLLNLRLVVSLGPPPTSSSDAECSVAGKLNFLRFWACKRRSLCVVAIGNPLLKLSLFVGYEVPGMFRATDIVRDPEGNRL